MSNSPEGAQPEQPVPSQSEPQLPPPGVPVPPPAAPTPPPPQWPPAGSTAPPPGAAYPPVQPQYPSSYAPYAGTPTNPVPQTNGMGIAGLVLALLGIVCVLPFIGSVLGIVFGWMGMKAADQGRADSRGLAKAGFILGIVGVGLFVVGAVIFLAVFILAAVNSDHSHVTITQDGF